jgi:hypothetical protein
MLGLFQKSKLEILLDASYHHLFNGPVSEEIHRFVNNLQGTTRQQIADELIDSLTSSSENNWESLHQWAIILLLTNNLKDLPGRLTGNISKVCNGQPYLVDLCRLNWQQLTSSETSIIYLMLVDQDTPTEPEAQINFWRLTLELANAVNSGKRARLYELYPMSQIKPGLSFERFMADSAIPGTWKEQIDNHLRQWIFEAFPEYAGDYFKTVSGLSAQLPYSPELLVKQVQFILHFFKQIAPQATVEMISNLCSGLTPPEPQRTSLMSMLRRDLTEGFCQLEQGSWLITTKAQFDAWQILLQSAGTSWTQINRLISQAPSILDKM